MIDADTLALAKKYSDKIVGGMVDVYLEKARVEEGRLLLELNNGIIIDAGSIDEVKQHISGYEDINGLQIMNYGTSGSPVTYRFVCDCSKIRNIDISENSLVGYQISGLLSFNGYEDQYLDHAVIKANEARTKDTTIIVITPPEGFPTTRPSALLNPVLHKPVFSNDIQYINNAYYVNSQEDWDKLVESSNWLGTKQVFLNVPELISNHSIEVPENVEYIGSFSNTDIIVKQNLFSFEPVNSSSRLRVENINLVYNEEDVERDISYDFQFFGFQNFNYLKNCKVNISSYYYATTTCGFINCNQLYNCEVKFINNFSGEQGDYNQNYGFKNCNQLYNCSVYSPEFKGDSTWFCGFEDCDQLVNCNIYFNKYYEQEHLQIGFYHCINLVNCYCIANKNDIVGVCFNNCSNISTSGLKDSTNNFNTDKVWVNCTKVDKFSCTNTSTLATSTEEGVIKVNPNMGLAINNSGEIYINQATNTDINTRIGYKPITPLNLDYGVRSVRPEVKQVIDTTAVINTIYDLGTQTNLSISLPSEVQVGDFIQVDFISGATPTTLNISAPSSALTDFDLVPEIDIIYTLYFDWGKLSNNTYGWRISYAEYTV